MGKKDLLDKSAVVQRDGETYALTPRVPGGLITDFSLLRRIADVAERYGVRAVKLTSAQRIAIIGVKEQDLDAVWRDLGLQPGHAAGLCVRSVKACPGTTYCRLGQQDSLGIAARIEESFLGQTLPNKLKIAVSGCPMCCAESRVRDIGLVGGARGYTVVVGGCAAAKPRVAQTLAEEVTPEAAEALVGRIIAVYREINRKKRIADLLEEMGIDGFRALVDRGPQRAP
jgi:NAD(P)H-nitrite reductase large subunit